jgi:hypothetical protein
MSGSAGILPAACVELRRQRRARCPRSRIFHRFLAPGTCLCGPVSPHLSCPVSASKKNPTNSPFTVLCPSSGAPEVATAAPPAYDTSLSCRLCQAKSSRLQGRAKVGEKAAPPAVVQFEFSKTILPPRGSGRFHAKAQSTQRAQRRPMRGSFISFALFACFAPWRETLP